jgi:hypothetical protein
MVAGVAPLSVSAVIAKSPIAHEQQATPSSSA